MSTRTQLKGNGILDHACPPQDKPSRSCPIRPPIARDRHVLGRTCPFEPCSRQEQDVENHQSAKNRHKRPRKSKKLLLLLRPPNSGAFGHGGIMQPELTVMGVGSLHGAGTRTHTPCTCRLERSPCLCTDTRLHQRAPSRAAAGLPPQHCPVPATVTALPLQRPPGVPLGLILRPACDGRRASWYVPLTTPRPPTGDLAAAPRGRCPRVRGAWAGRQHSPALPPRGPGTITRAPPTPM